MDVFADCLTFTLREEGGFVDNSRDPGGATNMGVTRSALAEWRDAPCSVADVQTLSRAEAEAIYGSRYWNVVHGEALPNGINLVVFDFGVNAGTARSARLLQAALNVPADGCIGPQTLACAAKVSGRSLLLRLIASQASYYKACSGFPTFGAGWLARLSRRQAVASGMLLPPVSAQSKEI